ncbi:thiosulfate oxidation carrier protein SoxY [Notoacmeibacter sp. MSK16QG-6]|uniref:thiosulfate oxidation carrier protein SoxY n=1 Tax=Notoacmeibacter sp. MSK16QG-6 TaxID=2957982 RepID=UPI00209D6D6D|nr:thiosulfate oxidation carrier protein SoxY [Notoacmeibacter sp. MSK16QG-6]MCP1200813.1 thiosulfate oxidation carrier protein SoxY [Notoacmeibacter sp. MSK16QG-6]
MEMNRRSVLGIVGAATTVAAIGLPVGIANATPEDAMAKVREFAGGKEPQTGGKLTLNTPEIAENGNSVPVGVSVDSAMEGDDMVEEIMILADGNPNPDVVTFKFTELSGEAVAETRMRLAKTQDVVAVAKMANGDVHMAKAPVKVTIGGCGG